ncbi:MAG: hypothetical protein AAFV69_09075 [Pseudomonadota bacterium]
MSTPNKRRGRPKGSGINDAAVLEEIACLIAAHADMKPTTAIKALGYSDPSSIRRLRDKFKAQERQVSAAKQKQKQSPETRASSIASPPGESRSVALQNGRDQRLYEPVRAQSQQDAPTRERKTPSATRDTKTADNDNDGKAGKEQTTQPAKPKRRRPELSIASPTNYDEKALSPLSAAMSAWQESLKSYQEISALQRQFTAHWLNSPATQMMISQQLAFSQMMLSAWPQKGFFQSTALIWASQPKR